MGTYLNASIFLSPPLYRTLRALEVLELENARVVSGQVLIWVPWTRPE